MRMRTVELFVYTWTAQNYWHAVIGMLNSALRHATWCPGDVHESWIWHDWHDTANIAAGLPDWSRVYIYIYIYTQEIPMARTIRKPGTKPNSLLPKYWPIISYSSLLLPPLAHHGDGYMNVWMLYECDLKIKINQCFKNTTALILHHTSYRPSTT